jgi:hypothetical protein
VSLPQFLWRWRWSLGSLGCWEVQWLVVLVQADVKCQANYKVVKEKDLLRLVAKHEMVPPFVSFVKR